MINLLDKFQKGLEKLDHWRDEILFSFIKPLWPRFITPNIITYARIIIGVALFILLFFLKIEDQGMIIMLFCVGVITDLLDGSVARGLNKVTEFGTMLDPVADRILILPIAVYGLYQSQKWVLLSLIAIEIVGSLIALYHKSKEQHVVQNIFGKTKMVIYSVVFAEILIRWPNGPSAIFEDALLASIFFAILSISVRIIELNKKGFIKIKIL